MLHRMGHRVETAIHGQDALALLGRYRFDCVLMDVQMPVLDGVATTKMIREGKAGVLDPRVPIVAQTAYALSGNRETFLYAGMSAYTSKPLDMRNLSEILARVVRMS
jgi:two-component system CheB/CheR fusion protein